MFLGRKTDVFLTYIKSTESKSSTRYWMQ